jgi:hypothetical protein
MPDNENGPASRRHVDLVSGEWIPMKVEAVGHPAARSAGVLSAMPRPTRPVKDAPDPAPVPTDGAPPETEETDGDGDKAAGVLRLLEAGHFKGVADVRLRINFFEELSARASAAAAPAVRGQAGDLIATMNARVDELIKPLATDEAAQATVDELRGQFGAAVQAASEQYASDAGVNGDSLIEAIQSAFDVLVHGLRGLLTPPPPPGEADAPAEPPAAAPVEGEAPAEPPLGVADTPAPSPLDNALASLTTAFDELLSGLGDSVATALHLPDPSPPSGNGSAYDKFLAIYNALRGVSAQVNEVG